MKQRVSLSLRVITILLIIFIILPVGIFYISHSPAQASSWAGWDEISAIYYNPAQEDGYNTHLEDAADDLETYLEEMSGDEFTVVTESSPDAPAIYLVVNASASALSGYGDEAFNIIIDDDGIEIVGKTALACRHGAYYLLDNLLGVRWFFPQDAWTYVPDTLTSIDAQNAVYEPDFFWRNIRLYTSEGTSDMQNWHRRNKLGSTSYYYGGHSYRSILDNAVGWNSMSSEQKRDYYLNNSDLFLPDGKWIEEGYPTAPWQLDPTEETVIQWAKDYADYIFGLDPYLPYTFWSGIIERAAVSITPNDGGGWNPPFSDRQDITNVVFALANIVAEYVSENYPGKYVATPSYASYSAIPDMELEPNIITHITTYYNYSGLTIPERIVGTGAKGAVMGVRDFIDIWQWWHDRLGTNLKVLHRIPLWVALGAQSYEGESVNNWGGFGHIHYALSKLLWDSTLDYEDVLDDFYTKAFGGASETMKTYYKEGGYTDNDLAHAFQLLDQAEEEASGDEEVLDRIRQIECHAYYMWKFLNIGVDELSDEELEDFYTFVTKVRDWYILTYKLLGGYLEDELSDRGYSSAQIEALQDFTTPTDNEVAAWMAEAMQEWGNYNYVASNIVNPLDLELDGYGDSETVETSECEGLCYTVIIPSDGNETVNIKVKGEEGSLLWYDSSALMLDNYQFSEVIDDWQTVSFTTYGPDNYFLHIPAYYDGQSTSKLSIDIDGRAASMLSSPGVKIVDLTDDSTSMTNKSCFYGSYSGYFYVPEGTEDFTFGMSPYSTQDVSVSLIDPSLNSHDYQCTTQDGDYHGGGGSEYVIESPESGLWQIDIEVTSILGYFWFEGISPLVWHDPEYLLVPAEATQPAPPVLNTIGDKTAYIGEPITFTVSAHDPNGDGLTYTASNLPAWASFSPLTRVFSGTPDQEGTHTNVHFEVSDGSFTDFENITITVLDGMAADVNGDGNINVLDMILIVQHWGESGTGGWIPEDVNKDGIIDILDITFIGQQWTG